MHITRRAVMLAALLSPAVSRAGAWGSGSFENDDALDWINDCVRSTGAGVVAAALRNVLDASYVEAPDASSAVAAAEIVAAARGKPGAGLPSEARAWLQRQPHAEISKLAPMAAKAMARVAGTSGSELQELWKRSTEYSSWQRSIQDLQARLR